MRFIFSLYIKAFSNLDRNIWILSLAMFINRTGSMVLLFAPLFFTNELKLSFQQAALAMSFYGIGSIAGSFAGGWLSDRRNYFDVMIGSLFISGLLLPAILFVEGVFSISCLLFLYAFASDMFRPAMSKGIAFYTNAENRTRSVSLIRLAINLGFSLGPAIGGFIALYFGYKPLFIIDGITSIMAGILVLALVPRKPIEASLEKYQPISATRSAYRDKEYLLFILLVAIYGMCFFQLFASVPKYLDEVWKYSSGEIGLIVGLNGAIVVLVEMPLMAVLQNFRNYFRLIVWGTLCIPAAFVILISGGGAIPAVLVYTLVITFSEILAMPFMMNFSLSRPEKERRGEYAALYSIAYGVSNTVAPMAGLGLAGFIGFDYMFQILIGTSVICGLGFYWLHKRLEQTGEFSKEIISENQPVLSDPEILDETGYQKNAEEII